MFLMFKKAPPGITTLAAATLLVAAPALRAQQAPQSTPAAQEGVAAASHNTTAVHTAATRTATGRSVLVAQAQTSPAGSPSTVAAASGSSGAEAEAEGALQEVIVTGTRQTGVEAAESPAPIQIVGSAALQQTASIPNLMNTLAQAVPSFTTQTIGGDMGGLTLQAKLDGLSPNEVLVLVNGKRRNTTANLSVDGGAFQGGAGVDLSLIPQDAIDHIEVLQDGAAAQYGSDAIAGVINVILKSNNSGGYITGTDGGYFDGGGEGGDVSANFGFQPLESSFFNVTAQVINHGHSYRSFPDLRSVVDTCPSTQDICSLPNSNMTQVAGWPYVNLIEGDGEQHVKLVSANGGYDFDNGVEFYTTTTFGDKDADTFENYRLPDKVHYVNSTTGQEIFPFPYGFDPQEAIKEIDYQQTTGLKGTLAGWRWDLSSGYGGDHIDVYTLDSANSGMVANYGSTTVALADQEPPNLINFYDGLLTTTQWVNNLDLDRNFDVGFASPLNVALGVEYRRETYSIAAGSPASWELGGAQSFPGWEPTDAGVHARNNTAGYVDFAMNPIDPLRIDLAGRYEHYSDFGNATVGKLTARYDFNPQFALRGTVNNGFRAPTLAEEYYSSTNVGPTTAFVQLPPNSAAGKVIGLGSGLQPEKSVNYSLGAVFRPIPRLNMTLDVYQITITDRIVGSGSIYGSINGVPVNPLVTAAILANGNQLDEDVLEHGTTGINLFTNGIDTRTRGAQYTLDFPVQYGLGSVDYSIGWSYNLTAVTAIYPNPPALGNTQLFNAASISALTTANPLWIANLGAVWTWDKFTLNVLEKIYGPTSVWGNDGGDNAENAIEWFRSTQGAAPITNITLGYQFNKHLSVTAGAENAFNKYPDLENPTLTAHIVNPKYVAADGSTGVGLYGPGAWGIDGGYYFVTGKYAF